MYVNCAIKNSTDTQYCLSLMVQLRRFELPQVALLESESSASTSSAIAA